MSRLDKLQSLLVFSAALLGLALGGIEAVGDAALGLVTPFLMVLLFGVFLQISAAHVGRAFKKLRLASISLGVNFIWTPLFAWGLGAVFLRGHPDLWVGLLMLMVTPCTDWYLIFTAMARGDLAFSTALLPVNLFLQLVLLPVYLLVLGGTIVEIELASLAESILLVLMLPFMAATALRALLDRMPGDAGQRVMSRVTHLPLLFLFLAVTAMFASQGEAVMSDPSVFALLLAPVVIFFAVNFLLAQALQRVVHFTYEETASLTLTTLARNSPLALAVAATAFPDRPLIALALVVGPLIELPILAVAAHGLLRLRGPRAGSAAVSAGS